MWTLKLNFFLQTFRLTSKSFHGWIGLRDIHEENLKRCPAVKIPRSYKPRDGQESTGASVACSLFPLFPPCPSLCPPPFVFPPNDRPVAAKSWLKFCQILSDCRLRVWFLPAPCLCVRRWSSLPGSGTSGGKHKSQGRNEGGRGAPKHPQRCPSHSYHRNSMACLKNTFS